MRAHTHTHTPLLWQLCTKRELCVCTWGSLLHVAHHALHNNNNNKRHEGEITTKENSKKRQHHYIHTYIHTRKREKNPIIHSKPSRRPA